MQDLDMGIMVLSMRVLGITIFQTLDLDVLPPSQIFAMRVYVYLKYMFANGKINKYQAMSS